MSYASGLPLSAQTELERRIAARANCAAYRETGTHNHQPFGDFVGIERCSECGHLAANQRAASFMTD